MRWRHFTDADWPQFTEFAPKYFGQSHPVDRKFNEFWFHTPRYDGWAIQIIEEDDRIVGMQMEIVVPAKFGDREVLLAWLSNIAVTEDAQARGAGARLLLWTYKNFPLVGATSGNDLSIPILDALGLKIPGIRVRRFIYIHHIRTANLCLSSDRPVVLGASFRPAHPLKTGLVYRWADGIPEDYDELWGRFREKFYLTTERSREYMTWRYLQVLYVEYKLLEMRANGELKAFAALRFEPTPEGNACRVLDFVADDEWAAEAWCSVTEAARTEGALFSDFFVIGTAQDEHLRRAGFLPADEETGLDAVPHLLSPVERRQWTNTFHMGGSLAKADQSWRRPEAVYFTKGDGDRDWPTTYYLANRSR